MVEKMSGSGGQSRATEALFKRAESMKKWLSSETAKEKPYRGDEQFTIKFDKGTVFLSAVASADIDEVTKLLDEGVDIDYKNNDGLTALHQACIDENKEMVTLLIERGADIEAVDNEGWTALHAAASAGDVEIAQILVDSGANLAAVNNEGEVPLDLAEEDEMDEFLSDEIDNQELEVEEARNEEERLLIEDATSWLNQKQIEENLDWQGATALHVAASKGYSKVISTLLQIPNIDVNFRDIDGWTPLHAAVHWGSKTACELLTDAGADFDIKNNNGQTPCDLAEPDFVKTAENCRKRSKELAKKPNFKNKRNDNGIDSNDPIYSKETDAIEMLKKQPPRPILKGSRAKAKALRNNENNSKPVVNNDKAEEVKPAIEKISPAKTSFTNTSVKTNSTSDVDSSVTSNSTKTSTFKSSRFADRDRDTKDDKKEDTTSSTPAPTRISVGIGIPSRTKTRDPEPEPTKPISSRFGQSRTDRLAGGFRQDEKKAEEPTRTTITTTSISSRLNQRPSSSSSRDEKGDDDSFLNRHRSKVKTNDENNWRTRKKDDENEPQETETKRTIRNETETIETRRSRTSAEDDNNSRMSIADRLRKKNQELLSSTSSDRGLTDSNSSSRYSSTTSSTSTTRNTNRPSLSSSTSDTGDTKELQRRLDQALREVDEYKTKYEKMKKEKEDLEKQLEQYKEDIEKVQELRSENTRIKDENGALIRVISKLSRTPTSSS